jgi:GT2 family glycosyltransferase
MTQLQPLSLPARAAAPSVPAVTAIVLNWCGHDDTVACLRSLLASDYPALTVLLVDNGSSDGSGAALNAAFPELAYLQTGANLGYTGGNNRGLRWALEHGCDYALVLNNDTVLEPAAVRHLVEAAEGHERAGAVAPKILYADAPERIWFGGGRLNRTRGVGLHRFQGDRDENPQGGAVEEVTFLTGCCLLLPADVLREVGGFDEDYFAYVEDVDLSIRLREHGYSLLYQPAARIQHRVPLDDRPSPFQIVQGVRNRRRLAQRRFAPLERLRFSAFFYPTRLAQIAAYVARGDGARALAVWKGMCAP